MKTKTQLSVNSRINQLINQLLNYDFRLSIFENTNLENHFFFEKRVPGNARNLCGQFLKNLNIESIY